MSEAGAYRFGNYLLFPAARELLHGGELVPLAPKSFDGLLWLVEHRERAVGRDELGAAIWGKTDVLENHLDQLIRSLRRAVGDNGSSQNVIRTVPRFGYRWVAPLEWIPASAQGVPATLSTPPREERPSLHDPVAPLGPTIPRAMQLTLGGLILLAVAAGAWWWHARTENATTRISPTVAPTTNAADALRPAASVPLIAVLPLATDAIDDSQWAWLRLGLMDLLAARLHDGGMPVVPTHNMVALLGPQGRTLPTVDKVREATGARIVIAPTIERSGDGWRLQLELSGMEGHARMLEIHAADPARAAREAADRVLVVLGQPPVSGHREKDDPNEEALVQRMEAAIAGNRFDMAKSLLDEAPQPLRQLPRVRLLEGELLFKGGQSAPALAEFEALADAPADSPIDAETRIRASNQAAEVLTGNKRFAEALTRLDAAVTLAKKSNWPRRYAEAIQDRGILHAVQGHFEPSDSDFSQARIALEIVGDTLGLAQLDATQAGTLAARRRFSDADVLLTHAIERLERFPAGQALATAMGNKITLNLTQLDLTAAVATAEKAQAMIDRSQATFPLNPTLAQRIIATHLATGHLSAVGPALRTQMAGLDPSKSPDLYAGVLILQAKLALDEGRPADAARLAGQAEDLRSSPGALQPHYAPGLASAARLHVHALLAQGKAQEARSALARFTQWAEDSTDPGVTARLRLAQAEQSALVDSPAVANRRFDAAMEAASQLAPDYLAIVATAYGHHLIAAGQLDQATRIIGRVARWAEQDFNCALVQVELYHALGQTDAWRRALATARRLAAERSIPSALVTAPMDSRGPAQRAHSGSPIH